MTLDPAEVAAASADWVWIPPEAETVETDELLVVRYPDWWEEPLELARLRPRRPLDEVLDEAVAAVGRFGLPRLVVWVRLDAPEGLAEALAARGATEGEVVDILALDLTPLLPDLDPATDVELRWVTDVPTARDHYAVNAATFGKRAPSDEEVAAMAERDIAAHAEGRQGVVVAYRAGRPIGSGGLTVAGDVLRLWGAGVVPEARGTGVYRAVLGARLQAGVGLGARMALVKGRVETSGPVLRRAGFTPYGQERALLLPI